MGGDWRDNREVRVIRRVVWGVEVGNGGLAGSSRIGWEG